MANATDLTLSFVDMSLSNTPDAATENTRLPQPNLPLPRELRDQIWGYLLRHEHVHDGMYRDRPMSKRGAIFKKHQRAVSRAHTFKFHTNVLAVNHTINAKCLEVLKSNEFIIVSHKVPVTPQAKHISSLPIVTENNRDCARFKYHVLRIHLQGSADCMARCLNEHDQKAFCMVASDLSRFCRLLQHHILACMPSSAPLVCGERQTPKSKETSLFEIDPIVDKTFYFRTNIQRLDKDGTIDSAKKLLAPFQQLTHGNQRVIMQDFPRSMATDLQHLKDVMAPSKIWIRAMVWHAIQNVHEEMTEAKTSVEAGDVDNALNRFEVLMRFASAPYFFGLPSVSNCAENACALGILGISLLDVGTTEMNLLMRTGKASSNRRYSLDMELLKLTEFVTTLPAVPRTKAVRMFEGPTFSEGPPTSLARAVWAGQMVALTAGSLPSTLGSLEVVHPGLKGDSHFEHDLILLRTLTSSTKLRTAVLNANGYMPEAMSRTSACSLPLRVYYIPVLDLCSTPESLEGYADHGHLAELRKDGFPG